MNVGPSGALVLFKLWAGPSQGSRAGFETPGGGLAGAGTARSLALMASFATNFSKVQCIHSPTSSPCITLNK